MENTKEERRITDSITVQLLESIKEDVHDLKTQVKDHIAEEEVVEQADIDRRVFIDMLIKREAKRNLVIDAIIEKTLTGLIWAAILFIGYSMLEYIKNHLMLVK